MVMSEVYLKNRGIDGMKLFSYSQYRSMIFDIQKQLPILDFSEITTDTQKYCVIRHDVEFSVNRALKLAEVENSIGIKSTYCFQLRNNNYNILSEKNIEIVNRIHKMGHHIAAHLHTDAFMRNPTRRNLKECIELECNILSDFLEVPINRFCFHRPKKQFLSSYIEVNNLTNLYGKLFFVFLEDNKTIPEIRYLSDSNHQWKYGSPFETDFSKNCKVQLNCHPFSWTDFGYNNLDNFLTLLGEKRTEVIESIKSEFKTFPNEIA